MPDHSDATHDTSDATHDPSDPVPAASDAAPDTLDVPLLGTERPAPADPHTPSLEHEDDQESLDGTSTASDSAYAGPQKPEFLPVAEGEECRLAATSDGPCIVRADNPGVCVAHKEDVYLRQVPLLRTANVIVVATACIGALVTLGLFVRIPYVSNASIAVMNLSTSLEPVLTFVVAMCVGVLWIEWTRRIIIFEGIVPWWGLRVVAVVAAIATGIGFGFARAEQRSALPFSPGSFGGEINTGVYRGEATSGVDSPRFTDSRGFTRTFFVDLPLSVDNAPVMVWIDGADWGNDLGREHPHSTWFAERGYVVVNIKYFRYSLVDPEWHLATNQILCDVAQAAEYAESVGADGSRVALAGYSTGGHLALTAVTPPARSRPAAPRCLRWSPSRP